MALQHDCSHLTLAGLHEWCSGAHPLGAIKAAARHGAQPEGKLGRGSWTSCRVEIQVGAGSVSQRSGTTEQWEQPASNVPTRLVGTPCAWPPPLHSIKQPL